MKDRTKLSQAERVAVLELLDSERFIGQPPREVYATLLEEGSFLCSIRTMYRVLRERGELRDRRDHRERGKHAVPRLVATAPNQVWTWDISKLATLVSGVFLNLYVVLDLFSRYVVAWMVAERENSALAQQLFAEAISRYGIEPGKLVVHQDRGAPMTAHGFAELLSALGDRPKLFQAARLERQPSSGVALPHREVSARLSRSIPGPPPRAALVSGLLRLVQRGPPRRRTQPLHARRRLLWAHRACRRPPPGGARESLRGSS